MKTRNATLPAVDTTYAGACRRALANAARTGKTFYIRPDSKGGFCVSDVRPETFTVAAMPKFQHPEESELRNMENWPIPIPTPAGAAR